jgi:hypothetical protein
MIIIREKDKIFQSHCNLSMMRINLSRLMITDHTNILVVAKILKGYYAAWCCGGFIGAASDSGVYYMLLYKLKREYDSTLQSKYKLNFNKCKQIPWIIGTLWPKLLTKINLLERFFGVLFFILR